MTNDPANATALLAEGVRVETSRNMPLVEDVSLRVGRGEVMGIVGESGSGKTTTARALMGDAPRGARIVSGSVSVMGAGILNLTERELRKVRGELVAYVPQNPASALNPALKIGTLLSEVLGRDHNRWRPGRSRSPIAFKDRATKLLAQAGLPADFSLLGRYPHQLSGGQQQRVAIAAAMACEPEVLILDEPATALDVITESAVLGEIQRRILETGTTVVYLTHDLGVVGNLADRVAVLYSGLVVEEGTASDILYTPRHPYTRQLLAALPAAGGAKRRLLADSDAPQAIESPRGCPFAPRCDLRTAACESLPALEPLEPLERLATGSSERDHRVRCWERHRTAHALPVEVTPGIPGSRPRTQEVLRVGSLWASYRIAGESTDALCGVDLSVGVGECLAVVGESGSGKSTLARCIVGLHKPGSGLVTLDKEPLAARASDRSLEQLRRLQLIFQDPGGSLNPRRKVGTQIGRQARRLRQVNQQGAEEESRRLLEEVHLPVSFAGRYPQELSGGEQQRVAIARTLAAEPDLLVCDEITSSLDVTVQALILELLAELRRARGLSLIFITHDLGLVSDVADYVGVMDGGELVEEGPAVDILSQPESAAARRLLSASAWKKLQTKGKT